MSRGGYREKAGRKSGWYHPETCTIRVPAIFADRLLEIAHALDSGEVIDFVTQSKRSDTKSKRNIDFVSKSKIDNVTESNEACPNCGANDWTVEGYRTLKSGQRKQKRKCKQCDRIWSVALDDKNGESYGLLKTGG